MTEQIIIDGVKTSKKDFIDNFSIELTNRNIFEREQIGDKYFEIILAKEQECEELKNFHINLVGVKECEIKELVKYKQALEEIKKIVETCNSGINCSECPYAEECRTDIEAEALGICKLILQKCEVINE